MLAGVGETDHPRCWNEACISRPIWVHGGSQIWAAAYNGDNLLVSLQDTASGSFPTQHEFSWGLGGLLYDLYQSATYTPGVSQRVNGVDGFFHTDWLGSTRYLSDGTGNSFPSALRYDAFGNRSATGGAYDPSVFQFAGDWGYQTQWATGAEDGPGLQYLEQRYYAPSIGRFISPDRISFLGGLNLYRYAGNDPVNSVDPSGLQEEDPLETPEEARQEAEEFAEFEAAIQEANQRRFNELLRRHGITPEEWRDDLLAFQNKAFADPLRACGEVRYRFARPSKPISEFERYQLALRSPEQRAYDVAKEFGINLRGSGKSIILRYDPNLGTGQFGKSRAAEPGVIYFGPDALTSDEELAKTLAHEVRHQRDYLAGKRTSPEGPAYASQGKLQEYIEGKRPHK